MMYDIVYSPKAIEDLKNLQRNEPAAFKKASKFIEELMIIRGSFMVIRVKNMKQGFVFQHVITI